MIEAIETNFSYLLNIGQIIRKKRRDLNLSQAQLAKKIGLNTQTIFLWEKGERFPSIPKAAKVIELLDKLKKEESAHNKNNSETYDDLRE